MVKAGLAPSGRFVEARDVAHEATRLAERIHYPVCEAAALEAEGQSASYPKRSSVCGRHETAGTRSGAPSTGPAASYYLASACSK